MVKIALFYIHDLAIAEDITQEIFTRLWERREKLDMIDNLKGYLSNAIKNRCLNYLDWIIGKLSSRTINKLDPVCLVILRMGLYQIFRMSKIPESAACNEAVKMARRFGNRGIDSFFQMAEFAN